MKLRATITIEYDADPEDYGTADPGEMARADQENGPWTLLEAVQCGATNAIPAYSVVPISSPISIDGQPCEEGEVCQSITVRRLDIRDFREAGFVHEINRLILHPAGLALEVVLDPQTGAESLGGVWDCTDDPEGILFGEDYLNPKKGERVADWIELRGAARVANLGFVIQPLPPDTRQLHLTIKEPFAGRVPGPGTWDEGEETIGGTE